MEYSQINTITKFGPDDYSLWTLTLPRDKIGQIRQQSPVVEGDIRQIFSEIRSGEEQPESICNFVLPHSNGLRLLTVDMGEDFAEKNRHNGCSVRGSREQIMVTDNTGRSFTYTAPVTVYPVITVSMELTKETHTDRTATASVKLTNAGTLPVSWSMAVAISALVSRL